MHGKFNYYRPCDRNRTCSPACDSGAVLRPLSYRVQLPFHMIVNTKTRQIACVSIQSLNCKSLFG